MSQDQHRLKALYRLLTVSSLIHQSSIHALEAYKQLSKKRNSQLNRKYQVMLARIRSGHSLLFRGYKHRISKSSDPFCKRCDSGQIDSVEHWLVCDSTVEARMQTFGYTNVELCDLTRWPWESVALARKTLFRDVADH